MLLWYIMEPVRLFLDYQSKFDGLLDYLKDEHSDLRDNLSSKSKFFAKWYVSLVDS